MPIPKNSLWSVLVVVLIAVPSIHAQNTSEQDSLALVALYNATDGPNWMNNNNWLTGPVSTWFGVVVSAGRVVDINLQSNNLIGTIPPELGNLANLEVLELGANQLTGSIPPELGNLANLFVQPIPRLLLVEEADPEDRAIAADTTLRYYDLSRGTLFDLSLGGSVRAVGTFFTAPFDGTIDRVDFELSNVGPSPGVAGTGTLRIKLLEATEVSLNPPFSPGVDSLDVDFADLVAHDIITPGNFINQIDVSSRDFEIQDSVEYFLQLAIVDESADEALTFIFDGGSNDSTDTRYFIDGGARTLLFLDFVDPDAEDGFFSLRDPSDTTFVHLNVLLELQLSEDLSVQGIEQDSLALVALYNATDGPNWTNNTNWLTGPVSTWFGVTMTGGRVTQVNLSLNNLIGTIPPELGNLANLEVLNLDINQLTGSIPRELSSLTNLTRLWLRSNPLTGSIPVELGNLANLTSLNFSANQLTGSIPVELGNLANLTSLNLNGNQLTGSIPVELGNLANLTYLGLQVNQLTGSIPVELGNLANLTIALFLDRNQLTGSIPVELGNLANLERLDLASNRFTGAIPVELGNLINLEQLGLQENGFVDLPDLSALQALTQLSVQNNRLTFEDLEPNVGITGFVYAPQASVGTARTETVNAGEDLTLSISVGGENNVYQWFKDGSALAGATGDSYTINAATQADVGTYTLEITNAVATDLTLQSEPITVSVLPPVATASFSLAITVSDGNNAQTLLFGMHPEGTDGFDPGLDQLAPPSPPEDAFDARFSLAGEDYLEDFRDNSLDEKTFTLRYQPAANQGPITVSWDQDQVLAQDSFFFAIVDNITGDLFGPFDMAANNNLDVSSADGLLDSDLRILASTIPLVVVDPKPSGGIAPVGDPYNIAVTTSAGFGPSTRQLFYRRSGEAPYQSVDLTEAGDSYQGIIPPSFVTERGVDYYVVLSDGPTTATFPTANPESNPAHLRARVDQLLAAVDLPSLTYQMVSVPLDLDDAQPAAVLTDDYSAYDTNQWRLFRWDADQETYREFPNIAASFTPGTAFWLNTRAGTAFDIDNGTSVDAADPYQVTLRPGWNQIATPFAFPVAWSSVSNSSLVEAPVAYDGSQYQFNQSVLQPWQGYFVFNPTGDSLALSFPPVAAAEAASKGASSPAMVAEASYVVRLSATAPGYGLRDTENYLGFNEQAAEGRDQLDFADPPGIGNHLRLSFIEAGEPLAGSFKPVGGEGRPWEVEVAVVIESEVLPTRKAVQVVLEEQGERPAGFAVYVLDKGFGRAVEVVDGVFSVEVSPSHPVRHLQVIVGTKRYAERGEIPLGLLEDALLQNYPNPFNPETVIRYMLSERQEVELAIYDVLGRRVRTLVRGEQEAGPYEAVWDGRDDGGVPVASGVYLYQLETGGFRATRRMLLLR